MVLTLSLSQQGEWEPSVCINFLVKFLNFAKEKVVSEPHTVHRFERTVSSKNYIRHSHDNSVTHILPKWYRQQLLVSQENDDWVSDLKEHTGLLYNLYFNYHIC